MTSPRPLAMRRRRPTGPTAPLDATEGYVSKPLLVDANRCRHDGPRSAVASDETIFVVCLFCGAFKMGRPHRTAPEAFERIPRQEAPTS